MALMYTPNDTTVSPNSELQKSTIVDFPLAIGPQITTANFITFRLKEGSR